MQLSRRTRNFTVGAAALGLVLVILGIGGCKLSYPYGHRGCTLRCVDSALQTYAHEHGGWFPDGENSYAALRKLYPEYASTGAEFAGVSGDIAATEAALRAGTPLDATLTSWVYTPGLRTDDDESIAILWESKRGLLSNGRRCRRGSRAVLLIGREITNVAGAEWPAFLRQQDALVKAARTMRPAQTNRIE